MVQKRTLIAIALLGLYPLTLKAPAQKPTEPSSAELAPTSQDSSALTYFKQKYAGIAALLPLNAFSKKPWAHDREERLNGVKELVEKIKQHLNSITNASNIAYAKKVKDNYEAMIKEAKSILQTHKERLGVNFQKLMNDLEMYEVDYANYVFRTLAEDEEGTQQTQWQQEQVSTDQPAQSTDPEWSEALAKQEKGSNITVRNTTNRPLYIAVYEKLNGKQPKRYGDIYDVNAGATATIKRPEWNISTRLNKDNDRLLYFSANKSSLGLGIEHDTVNSIGIGEGSGFTSKTSFTINQSDLKQ